MPDDRAGISWKQITLFLLTLGVLILCALLLHPFFSAIVGAIVLAVVTQRPYDWLASRIKNRSLCAAVTLTLIVLAVIIPTFFLAQKLGEQALNTVHAFRNGAHQEKITSFIANRPALANRIEDFTSSIDVNNAAVTPSEGKRPGGTVANQRTLTVTITAIDQTIPSITVTSANGWVYSRKVTDRKALAQVKVGDKLDLTWNDAVLISFAEAKK